MNVGFVGTRCSGRSTAAGILRQKGLRYFSFGDYLTERLEKLGYEPTSANKSKLANRIRQINGPSYIAEEFMQRLRKNEQGVFESIFSIGEYEALRHLPNFLLVAMDAPEAVRYERCRYVNNEGWFETMESFREGEEKLRAGAPYEQNVDALMAKADITIYNNNSLRDLEETVRSIV